MIRLVPINTIGGSWFATCGAMSLALLSHSAPNDSAEQMTSQQLLTEGETTHETIRTP